MFTLIFTENEVESQVELDNTEFKVLNLAVSHNHGIVNLLSEKQAIQKLFNCGLLTFNNDDLLKVKDKFQSIFNHYNNKNSSDFIQGSHSNGITLIEE